MGELIKTEWIRCPVCRNKTRLQTRADTDTSIPSRSYPDAGVAGHNAPAGRHGPGPLALLSQNGKGVHRGAAARRRVIAWIYMSQNGCIVLFAGAKRG